MNYKKLISFIVLLNFFLIVNGENYLFALRPPVEIGIQLTDISKGETISFVSKRLKDKGKIVTQGKSLKELEKEIAQIILYPAGIKRSAKKDIEKLFGPDHLWGLFMFDKRQSTPEILDPDERNYQQWVKLRVRKELNGIKNLGYSLSEQETREIINHTLNIYEFYLPNGKKLKEVITNNEWSREITTRIINILLKGDPEHGFYISQAFNKSGKEISLRIINEIKENLTDKSIMKLAIASGIFGLSVKNQIRIITGQPDGRSKDEAIEELLEKDKVMLQKKLTEELAIDFWDEFEEEIITNQKPIVLGWITDDYIETIFDLYFIQRLLSLNPQLTVKLISRKGRWDNDASGNDVLEFLSEPVFRNLNKFFTKKRLVIVEGIVGEGPSDKNITEESVNVFEEADFIFAKGLDQLERLNGINKVTYFAFVVSNSYSESIAGLSRAGNPMVLVRQNPGENLFENFVARAFRKMKIEGNKVIPVAGKTLVEYANKVKGLIRIKEIVNNLLRAPEKISTEEMDSILPLLQNNLESLKIVAEDKIAEVINQLKEDVVNLQKDRDYQPKNLKKLLKGELNWVVDKKDRIIGVTDRRLIHFLGLYHRTAIVFSHTPKGKLILLRRSTGRPFGLYFYACGGHLTYPDFYEEGARKEIEEELSFSARPKGNLVELHKSLRDYPDDIDREWRMHYDYKLTEQEYQSFVKKFDELEKLKGTMTEEEFAKYLREQSKQKTGAGEVYGYLEINWEELSNLPMEEVYVKELGKKIILHYIEVTDSFKDRTETRKAYLTPDFSRYILEQKMVESKIVSQGKQKKVKSVELKRINKNKPILLSL